MAEAVRLSPETRKTLQTASVVGLSTGAFLVVVGVGLLIWNMATMEPPSGPDDPGTGMGSAFVGFSLFGFGGFVAVGSLALASFAFRKSLSELAATDTEVAVEHSAGAFARGMRGVAGMGAPSTVVKVKCRSCGYLDSEDAKFCSGCAATL